MLTIFPFSIFFYQIHILQLENYDLGRFVKHIIQHLFNADTEKEKDIKWTTKLTLVSAASIAVLFVPVLYISLGVFPNIILDILISILLCIALAPLFWIVLSLATVLFSPLDLIAKERIIRNARKKLLSFPKIKIVAITGSYGKTTMKDVISTVLGIRYRVVSTKGNYNTPIGISRQILEDIDEDTDIFVVEMGAYKKGDIAELCGIAKPDISILTGINEAHLERFGSIENTVDAKFDIVGHCAADGKIVLNADDKRIVSSYKKYKGNQEVYFFSKEKNELCKYNANKINFDKNGKGISFILDRESKIIGEISTPFIAEYIVGDVISAFIVGGLLGMTDAEIQAGVKHIKQPKHRLNTQKTPNDMIVIDDSYNGNLDGVYSAIEALSRFTSRRKIYITPGLVEVGDMSEELHEKIGVRLGKVADIVFLIENSTTDAIKRGLEEAGFNTEHLYVYKNKQDAYKKLGQMSLSGDVVLFQNDWPENYV